MLIELFVLPVEEGKNQLNIYIRLKLYSQKNIYQDFKGTQGLNTDTGTYLSIAPGTSCLLLLY